MTIHRLYTTETLSAGQSCNTGDKQAHYLQHVLRLNVGDHVLLFNGRDGEWQATLTHCYKKHVTLQCQHQTQPQSSSPDIWLVFSPIKAGRIDFLVQKATELGVSCLAPVKTERTIVSRVNEDRLRANVMEAAEQTGRLDVPDILPYQPLASLLEQWNQERPLIYGDESGNGLPAPILLDNKAPPLAVLVGCEGGFTDKEFTLFHQCNFMHPLSLGHRILRADTAALASLTLLQLYCGDWYPPSTPQQTA